MQDVKRFLPIGSLADRMGASEEWRGEALLLRGRRQALMAGNIANADTPNYQARDLDFSQAMAQALDRENTPTMSIRSARHLATAALGAGKSTLELAGYTEPSQGSLDNNTVDPDRERAGFAKNAILYEFAKLFYEDEFKEFQGAAGDPMKAPR